MTRWLTTAAVGGAIGIAAIAIVLVLSSTVPVTDADRVDRLARELRCPDCQGLSVADSPTASAREIRRQIGLLVEDGTTDDGVRAHFVDRYGQWILLAPSSPAAWIIPFAVVAAGTLALGAWLVRRRTVAPAARMNLTDDERRRLRAEAEALDA